MVTIIGTLAAILTTSAMFPQAYKIIRSRNVSSISLTMYIANAFGILMWFTYGVMIDNLIIVITNTVAIIPASTILTLKIYLTVKGRQNIANPSNETI